MGHWHVVLYYCIDKKELAKLGPFAGEIELVGVGAFSEPTPTIDISKYRTKTLNTEGLSRNIAKTMAALISVEESIKLYN